MTRGERALAGLVVGLVLVAAWRWGIERPAALAWRAPSECIEVYRVRIDEHYRDPGVAAFLGRDEEHRTYHLALAGDPGRSASAELTPVFGVLIGEGEDPRVRELWWSREWVGPSAPDFACRRRSWDPLEDALALGWPRLSARAMSAGDAWIGAAVEGRCHETVCLDPDGTFGHAIPCRARPWSEALVATAGPLAWIRGRWDDGHDPGAGEDGPKGRAAQGRVDPGAGEDGPKGRAAQGRVDLERPEIGILTSRELVLDEGRPLHVRATIDQRWAGVRRELSLVRVDDCGARVEQTGDALAETRAQFLAQFHARLSSPTAD